MTGKRAGGVAAMIVGVAAMASSCTKTQLQGDSSSYLIIDSLFADGAGAANKATVINSAGCAAPSACVSDVADVTFELALKNPGTASDPTTPSAPNFVTVTRYHVDYVRSDGRNTQGVDVPFSFDGAVTVTVNKASAIAVFPVVRAQAKMEAPLSAVGLGSTPALSLIARVTFYGTDQAGRDVSVTGQIGVNFGSAQ